MRTRSPFRVRATLDSNVWLAVLTTDGFCRRVWKKIHHDCVICTSADICEEIEDKLRGKFGFSDRHARLLTLFVERHSELVKPVTTVNACRDADDNRILAAAVDGGCSHLVTGDKDLLVLKNFQGVIIVSPREFDELVPHS